MFRQRKYIVHISNRTPTQTHWFGRARIYLKYIVCSRAAVAVAAVAAITATAAVAVAVWAYMCVLTICDGIRLHRSPPLFSSSQYVCLVLLLPSSLWPVVLLPLLRPTYEFRAHIPLPCTNSILFGRRDAKPLSHFPLFYSLVAQTLTHFRQHEYVYKCMKVLHIYADSYARLYLPLQRNIFTHLLVSFYIYFLVFLI